MRTQKRGIEDRGNLSSEDFPEEVVFESDFKTKSRKAK